MQLTSVFTVTTVLLQWTKAAPQRSDKVSIIYFPEDEPRPLRPWERQNSDGILKRTLTPTRVKPAKPSSHKTSTRRQLTRDILIHFPPDGYTTPADGYTTPADDHTTPKSAVQRRTQLTTTDVDDIVIRYPTNGQNIPGGKLLDRPSIDTFDLPSATDVDNSLLTKKSSSKHTDTDDSDGADSSSEEASKKDCPLRVQLPHDQEAEAICIPEWQCKGLVLVGYELGSECGSSERRYVCCNPTKSIQPFIPQLLEPDSERKVYWSDEDPKKRENPKKQENPKREFQDEEEEEQMLMMELLGSIHTPALHKDEESQDKDSETEAETKTKAETENVVETEIESEVETETGTKDSVAEIETESKVKTETEDSEAEIEIQSEVKTETEDSEVEIESDSETKAEIKNEAETEGKTKVKSEVKTETEAKTESDRPSLSSSRRNKSLIDLLVASRYNELF